MYDRAFAFCFLLMSLMLPAAVAAQPPPPPLDGPHRVFRDALLDNLTGRWRAGGQMGSEKIESDLSVEWALGHQFLRLHFQDAGKPQPGEPPYEAAVYIGYDNMSERYVAHWMDVFGGRWSETLGYGKRDANSIKFVFEYPDGPFHTTFTWQPQSKTWRILMEQKDKSGKWTKFAEQTLRRLNLK